jgi:acetolactate synthase I/II/III large subunit
MTPSAFSPTALSRADGRATQMNGADAILRSLEAEGVDICFGIPGGAILPLYDALARGTTVRHVLARHEQGAGHMAQGYARVCGQPGVVIATSGPGATNLVTPLADAAMDSTPLVCVTGQVRSHLIGTDAFQECDIVGITHPIVKHSWQVRRAKDIPATMQEAFRIARSGRPGPVLVDVPRDVQEEMLAFHYQEVTLPREHPLVDSSAVAAATRLVAKSERPVVYAGGGVVNADASDHLVVLAQLLGAPVVTTLMGKGGFPESHRLFAGHPGMHGAKYANWALNKADLIVAVAARFDDRVTGRLDAFAPDAKVIHLDVDPYEISKIRHADVALVGELADTLPTLAAAAAGAASHRRTRRWRAFIEESKQRYPYRYEQEPSRWPRPQQVLERLDVCAAGLDPIYTTGVGQHQMWAMQYLHCDRPRRFVTSGGLATMGFGLPAAIGAKAALPERPVICIDGDGSFQMTSQELATAVQERLPVIVVLINNASLGMVRQWQTLFYEERVSHVHLTHQSPNYAELARAYGAAGHTANSLREFDVALDDALADDRPSVIDVRVDPRERVYPMIPPGAAAIDCIEAPSPSA